MKRITICYKEIKIKDYIFSILFDIGKFPFERNIDYRKMCYLNTIERRFRIYNSFLMLHIGLHKHPIKDMIYTKELNDKLTKGIITPDECMSILNNTPNKDKEWKLLNYEKFQELIRIVLLNIK